MDKPATYRSRTRRSITAASTTSPPDNNANNTSTSVTIPRSSIPTTSSTIPVTEHNSSSKVQDESLSFFQQHNDIDQLPNDDSDISFLNFSTCGLISPRSSRRQKAIQSQRTGQSSQQNHQNNQQQQQQPFFSQCEFTFTPPKVCTKEILAQTFNPKQPNTHELDKIDEKTVSKKKGSLFAQSSLSPTMNTLPLTPTAAYRPKNIQNTEEKDDKLSELNITNVSNFDFGFDDDNDDNGSMNSNNSYNNDNDTNTMVDIDLSIANNNSPTQLTRPVSSVKPTKKRPKSILKQQLPKPSIHIAINDYISNDVDTIAQHQLIHENVSSLQFDSSDSSDYSQSPSIMSIPAPKTEDSTTPKTKRNKTKYVKPQQHKEIQTPQHQDSQNRRSVRQLAIESSPKQSFSKKNKQINQLQDDDDDDIESYDVNNDDFDIKFPPSSCFSPRHPVNSHPFSNPSNNQGSQKLSTPKHTTTKTTAITPLRKTPLKIETIESASSLSSAPSMTSITTTTPQHTISSQYVNTPAISSQLNTVQVDQVDRVGQLNSPHSNLSSTSRHSTLSRTVAPSGASSSLDTPFHTTPRHLQSHASSSMQSPLYSTNSNNLNHFLSFPATDTLERSQTIAIPDFSSKPKLSFPSTTSSTMNCSLNIIATPLTKSSSSLIIPASSSSSLISSTTKLHNSYNNEKNNPRINEDSYEDFDDEDFADDEDSDSDQNYSIGVQKSKKTRSLKNVRSSLDMDKEKASSCFLDDICIDSDCEHDADNEVQLETQVKSPTTTKTSTKTPSATTSATSTTSTTKSIQNDKIVKEQLIEKNTNDKNASDFTLPNMHDKEKMTHGFEQNSKMIIDINLANQLDTSEYSVDSSNTTTTTTTTTSDINNQNSLALNKNRQSVPNEMSSSKHIDIFSPFSVGLSRVSVSSNSGLTSFQHQLDMSDHLIDHDDDDDDDNSDQDYSSISRLPAMPKPTENISGNIQSTSSYNRYSPQSLASYMNNSDNSTNNTSSTTNNTNIMNNYYLKAISKINNSLHSIDITEKNLNNEYPLRNLNNLQLLNELHLTSSLCNDRAMSNTAIMTSTLLSQLRPQVGPIKKYNIPFQPLSTIYHLLYPKSSLQNENNISHDQQDNYNLNQESESDTPLSFILQTMCNNNQMDQNLIDNLPPCFVQRAQLNDFEQLIVSFVQAKQYRHALWSIKTGNGQHSESNFVHMYDLSYKCTCTKPLEKTSYIYQYEIQHASEGNNIGYNDNDDDIFINDGRQKTMSCLLKYLYIWLEYITMMEDRDMLITNKQKDSIFNSTNHDNTNSNSSNSADSLTPFQTDLGITALSQHSLQNTLSNDQLVFLCQAMAQHIPLCTNQQTILQSTEHRQIINTNTTINQNNNDYDDENENKCSNTLVKNIDKTNLNNQSSIINNDGPSYKQRNYHSIHNNYSNLSQFSQKYTNNQSGPKKRSSLDSSNTEMFSFYNDQQQLQQQQQQQQQFNISQKSSLLSLDLSFPSSSSSSSSVLLTNKDDSNNPIYASRDEKNSSINRFDIITKRQRFSATSPSSSSSSSLSASSSSFLQDSPRSVVKQSKNPNQTLLSSLLFQNSTMHLPNHNTSSASSSSSLSKPEMHRKSLNFPFFDSSFASSNTSNMQSNSNIPSNTDVTSSYNDISTTSSSISPPFSSSPSAATTTTTTSSSHSNQQVLIDEMCPFLLYLHALLLSNMTIATVPDFSSNLNFHKQSSSQQQTTTTALNLPCITDSITTSSSKFIPYLLCLALQRLPTLWCAWELLLEGLSSYKDLQSLILPAHPFTRIFLLRAYLHFNNLFLSNIGGSHKSIILNLLNSLQFTFPRTTITASLRFLVSIALYDPSLPLRYTIKTQTSTITASNTIINDSIGMDSSNISQISQSTTHNVSSPKSNEIVETLHQDDPRQSFASLLQLDPYCLLHDNLVLTSYTTFLRQTHNSGAFEPILRMLISNAPSAVFTHAALADYYVLLNNLPSATNHIQQAILLAKTPTRLSQLWFSLAIIWIQNNVPSRARHALYISLRHNPENVKAYFYLAYIFRVERHYTLALSWLTKCTSKDPHNALYWIEQSNCYNHLTDYKQSLRCLKQAVRISAEQSCGLSESPSNNHNTINNSIVTTLLLPSCIKTATLLRTLKRYEEAANYFSIVLHYNSTSQHITTTTTTTTTSEIDDTNNNMEQLNDISLLGNMTLNDKALTQIFNKKFSLSSTSIQYLSSDALSLVDPKDILFVADIRWNQGNIRQSRHYLEVLIQNGKCVDEARSLLSRCPILI